VRATLSTGEEVVTSEVGPDGDGSWTTTLTVPAEARNGLGVVDVACLDGETPYFDYGRAPFQIVSPEGQSDRVFRFAGADRFETAVAVSQDLFPTTASAASIVISRADDYADSIAGTPLAVRIDGPMLLTNRDSLDPRTAAEIERVLTPGGRIVVLGGTSAIGDNAFKALQALGYPVTRVAGTNRFETAVQIASFDGGHPGAILLANAAHFQEGLMAGAAAPWAAPRGSYGAVLLTSYSEMPAATAQYIHANTGIPRIAIGSARLADPDDEQVDGGDYFWDAYYVAKRFFPVVVGAAVASVENFPDALTGGVHAAFNGVPLFLSQGTGVETPLDVTLSGAQSIAYIYGGTAVISDNTEQEVTRQINN
jgi:hypothetical protein